MPPARTATSGPARPCAPSVGACCRLVTGGPDAHTPPSVSPSDEERDRDRDKDQGPKEPDNVVALSRYRALLARGRRVRRGDELLDAPDPERAIRALPPDEFYYVLAERGLPEATELLVHGTAPQVQAALDFVLWDRDQVSPARVNEWLGAMVEAPADRMGEWLRGLDVELVALLLRKRARIYDRDADGEGGPDEPEGTLLETPDRFFIVDLLGTDDEQRITQHLLDSLYRYDIDLARRLFVGLKAEIDSELEETAYRWRSGRMADLGFVDYYEALGVYQELDPATVKIGEAAGSSARVRPHIDVGAEPDSALRVPTVLAERLGTTSPFARAVSGIQDAAELAELHAALVALSNRVLSADRIVPSNVDGIAATLARVQATLDLGVESLARGVDADALAAVRTIPLVRLFRVGVSVVGKLRRLSGALRTGNAFRIPPVGLDLFEREDVEVLEALGRPRPMFPLRLEDPAANGERPFASLVDVALATAAVERAAASLGFAVALGVRPEHLTPERRGQAGINESAALDFGVLARTVLARRLVGAPAGDGLPMLQPDDLTKLRQQLASGRKKSDYPAQLYLRVLEQLTGPRAPDLARRWAASLIAGEPVLLADGRIATL